jgi:YggT family protein
MGFFRDAALLLIQVAFGIVLLIFALRLLLPLTRVRFNNQICQFVYKVTNPIVGPVSQVVPAVRQFSLATLLVLWLILLIEVALVFLIVSFPLRVDYVLLASTVGVLHFLVGIGFWVVLFSAIASFFAPDRRNPAVEALFGLAEPLLRPFRNFPPRNMPFSLAPLYAGVALRLILLALQHLLGPLYRFVLPL